MVVMDRITTATSGATVGSGHGWTCTTMLGSCLVHAWFMLGSCLVAALQLWLQMWLQYLCEDKRLFEGTD